MAQHTKFQAGVLLLALWVVALQPASAAANYDTTDLTWFSRANCAIPFPYVPYPYDPSFNESISWTTPFGSKNRLWTFSHHNLNGYALQDQSNWVDYHNVASSSGFVFTWRSYAGHFHLQAPMMWVHGEHHLDDPWFGWQFLGFTFATDCNITEW